MQLHPEVILISLPYLTDVWLPLAPRFLVEVLVEAGD